MKRIHTRLISWNLTNFVAGTAQPDIHRPMSSQAENYNQSIRAWKGYTWLFASFYNLFSRALPTHLDYCRVNLVLRKNISTALIKVEFDRIWATADVNRHLCTLDPRFFYTDCTPLKIFRSVPPSIRRTRHFPSSNCRARYGDVFESSCLFIHLACAAKLRSPRSLVQKHHEHLRGK